MMSSVREKGEDVREVNKDLIPNETSWQETEEENTMTQQRLSPRELADLLESHRHKLVGALEVARLLPMFRSAGLMDRRDEQEITNPHRHPSSYDQAGCLLDKILARDPKAMQLLLDHVEDNHPSLFKEMTGREARMPVSLARVKTFIDRSRGGLAPKVVTGILTELSESLQKNIELDRQRTKENEEQARIIRQLRSVRKRLLKENEGLSRKAADNEKMKSDLETLNSMLMETKDRAMIYQREAEKAKHFARLATFKNFHMEWELKECQNKFNLERRQTRHLRQSAKVRDQWMEEHRTTFQTDRVRIEQLQEELEKIDNLHNSGLSRDSSLSIRIKNQLDQAHKTNESLNLRLQKAEETINLLKNERDLMKNRQKMMKENMEMNRKHLEMSQRELEIVSKERARINQNYSKLFQQMSQTIIEHNQLQAEVNSLRIQYAVMSERLLTLNSQSSDSSITTGVYSQGDDDDDANAGDVDDGEDSSVCNDDKDNEEDRKVFRKKNRGPRDEEQVKPITRERVHRLTSMTSSNSRRSLIEKKKGLEDEFGVYAGFGDAETEDSAVAFGNTSPHQQSSSTTTGEEDDSKLSGDMLDPFSSFETRSFDTDEDESDHDGMTMTSITTQSLEEDYEFMDRQNLIMRTQGRSGRPLGSDTRRRSQSLSRLEDYEAFDAMPITCHSIFPHNDSITKFNLFRGHKWNSRNK